MVQQKNSATFNSTDSCGGCNSANWLIQTRRNLAIEYLNLNFVATPKLTSLHYFKRKSFLFLAFGPFLFHTRVRTCPSLFDTNILQPILSDLKLSTRSLFVNISNYLKRKTILPEKMQRK